MQHVKDVYDIGACFEAPLWGPRRLHIGTNLQAQHLLYQITHWRLGHNSELRIRVHHPPHAPQAFIMV